MDKKEYLLTVLTKLESKWDMAKWLKFLIEKWNLDDNLLDIIIQALESSINTTQKDHDFVEFQKAVKKS